MESRNFNDGTYLIYSKDHDRKAIPLIKSLFESMPPPSKLNSFDAPKRQLMIWSQTPPKIDIPQTKLDMKMKLNELLGQQTPNKLEDVWPEATILNGSLEGELGLLNETLRQQWKVLRFMSMMDMKGVDTDDCFADTNISDYMLKHHLLAEEMFSKTEIETIRPVVVAFFNDVKEMATMFSNLGYLEKFSIKSVQMKMTFVLVLNSQELYKDFIATVRSGIQTVIITDPVKQDFCNKAIAAVGDHKGKAWRVNEFVEKAGVCECISH
jgi:hypothetical protein